MRREFLALKLDTGSCPNGNPKERGFEINHHSPRGGMYLRKGECIQLGPSHVFDLKESGDGLSWLQLEELLSLDDPCEIILYR